MKSITILSLTLFEIAITASLSLLFSFASSTSPPISLLFPPFLRLPSYCPFPRLPPWLYTALTFILPYLSSSASTALVFFIFHSTFILPFLLYFHLSFSFLPALSLCFLLPSVSPFLWQHLSLSLSTLYWFLFLHCCLFSSEHSLNSPLTVFNTPLFLFPLFTNSAHPGWCDHRSHHRGGARPAGAHCCHLLPDEVPGGAPRLQPQCQVSDRPVAGGALPVRSVPGIGAEAGADPWHRHLRGQAGIAAMIWFG